MHLHNIIRDIEGGDHIPIHSNKDVTLRYDGAWRVMTLLRHIYREDKIMPSKILGRTSQVIFQKHPERVADEN